MIASGYWSNSQIRALALACIALIPIGISGCNTSITPPSSTVSDLVEELDGDAGVDGKTWLVSFAQAKRISEATGKPILADFTGSDWCGWCIKLDEEVFSTPVFVNWAKSNVVLLKLDYPQAVPQSPALVKQNDTLQSVYRISGFPTVLFLDSQGNPIGESGYRTEDPTEWVTHAASEIGSANSSATTTSSASDSSLADEIVEELEGDAGVDGQTWLVSFAQAKRLSESTGRPILADFTGSDWCGWCVKLDEDVFSTPVFRTWAKSKVILLKLDYPQAVPQAPALVRQNEKLQKIYDISGFPTILFLDSKGNPIGQSGYRSADPLEWVTHATTELGS